jgi:hypothetical protein
VKVGVHLGVYAYDTWGFSQGGQCQISQTATLVSYISLSCLQLCEGMGEENGSTLQQEGFCRFELKRLAPEVTHLTCIDLGP